MSEFSTIGLITKPGDVRLTDTVHSLVNYLRSKSLDIIVDQGAAILLQDPGLVGQTRQDMARHCDLIIVVGGDGTLLHAARSLVSSQIPMLGINRGRLGFLVDVSPDDIAAALDGILAGQYKEEYRFLLHAEVVRDGMVIAQSEAFNDVVVHVRNVVRMIELDTYVDGRYLNTQRADGLIVATPTGSTAYALSGGGPILHPSLNAIVLVPVCPHTLSNRPIVVDAESRIEIKVCERNNPPARVSFDGQANVKLLPKDCIKIRRQSHLLRLIQPIDHDYFEILRAKLRWSEQL
ncbi:MAG: NAD(+) kinase [Pseudomonadota bacterium]